MDAFELLKIYLYAVESRNRKAAMEALAQLDALVRAPVPSGKHYMWHLDKSARRHKNAVEATTETT